MSTLTLTKTKFSQGLWQGILTQSGEAEPVIEVTHDNVPIPAEAVGDGVHTLLVRDKMTDTTLGQITLIAGEALGDDIRAEMDLLRAELDMLKRAFRRHCLET